MNHCGKPARVPRRHRAASCERGAHGFAPRASQGTCSWPCLRTEGVLLQFYTGGSHCHSAVTQRGLRKAISQGRRSLAQARVFRYRPRLEALCCAEKARVISRYAELLGDAQRAPTRKTDKTRQSLVRLDK